MGTIKYRSILKNNLFILSLAIFTALAFLHASGFETDKRVVDFSKTAAVEQPGKQPSENSHLKVAVAAICFIQKQKSFLEDHLMAWVPEFAKNIIENTENPFYPNLAKATQSFIHENYQIVC